MALTMDAQKCAVLEFRGSASVSLADIDGISEMFMTYFRPSGYTMVERAQIDKVISEQQFQRSNITDNQAVQVGKILNASIVILGKISKLGGQYQVDVRAVAVQSGHDIALEGATFSGDYRTNVRNLATKLAGKVAITSGGTVSAAPSQSRTEPYVIYGYLKVFPTDLGSFDAEPRMIITRLNQSQQYGYGTWRLPTNEELQLMRANNVVGSGNYMTKENKKGVVRLVTDKEKGEVLPVVPIAPDGYVNLGLQSGTLWKDQNEGDGYFFYLENVVEKFGDSLPTKEKWIELQKSCQWTWIGNGYEVEGPNGMTIVLPAAGCYEDEFGGQVNVGSGGHYWSSTPYDSKYAWGVDFYSDKVEMSHYARGGRSVRLVKNP